MRFFSKQAAPPNLEYYCQWVPADTGVYFGAWHSGVLTVVKSGTDLATGAWTMIDAYFDNVALVKGIALNGAAFVTAAAGSDTIDDGAAQFTVGSINGTGEFANGRIAGLSFWKRVLTAKERSYMRNGGAGRTFFPGRGFR